LLPLLVGHPSHGLPPPTYTRHRYVQCVFCD
jgi:hypothetical protein